MNIGISSWSYPYAIGNPAHERPQDPMGAVALAEKALMHGAQVLQIADNLPLHTQQESALQTLGAIAQAHCLTLEVGTAGLEEHTLFEYLALAQQLGARLVRTLPHRGSDVPSMAQARQRLEKVLPRFEAAGVVLGIENHDHYPSAWIRELVDTFQSPHLGVCLDAVNNLGLGESFREVLNTLGPVTVNFHCKDYDIHRKPSMLGFDVVGAVAGEGLLDLDLAKKVLPAGISWILESWLPWQGDLPATLAMEEDWVAKGMQNLRKVQDVQETKAP